MPATVEPAVGEASVNIHRQDGRRWNESVNMASTDATRITDRIYWKT